MKLGRRLTAVFAVPVLTAGIGLAAASGAAQAAPVLTAVTHVVNNDDDGGNGFWSVDDVTRTVTFSVDTTTTDCATVLPAGNTCYSATVTDHGQWNAIAGAFTPNQHGGFLGRKIAHAVTGTFSGGATYAFYAPTADVPSAANVAHLVNDHFTKPTSGEDSTSQWYLQAFLPGQQGAVHGPGILNTWSWTYRDACESWTDSAANGDGQGNAAGNITGRVCAVPVLFGGKAVFIAPTRENVEFRETIGTWVMFKIVGPGPINGHEGWVHAQGGGVLNEGVYSGLNGGNGVTGPGYTVIYTAVTGPGSFHQVPGTRSGSVFFRS
jgi:hypothetical protein